MTIFHMAKHTRTGHGSGAQVQSFDTVGLAKEAIINFVPTVGDVI